MSDDLTASVVYLDEGEKEGGIAHPTQDLIASLEDRIEVREVPITQGRSSDPRYWYHLGCEASEGADVVHIQFEYGSFGDLGGKFLGSLFPVFAHAVDVPMVATLHNFRDRQVSVSLTDPNSIVMWLSEHATWFVDRSLVNNVDFFVPLMHAEVSLLRRHDIPTNRIKHIPLVSETDPEFRDADACKRELGLEDKSVITAFGWVRRSKGYDRVIDVLEHLPDDAVFLVAGGTRTDEQEVYLNELRDMVARRGLSDRVEFTGYVGREEHPTIMNATDVMVFPYRDNRASDALARALSYHLPVVASDNEEFSAIEAEWGCVTTVSDNEDMREALTAVLENPKMCERLELQAEKYAAEMNWDTVAERTVEIYRDLVDS